MRRYVLPVMGDRPLQSIRPLDVQQLYAGLADLSPRTRNHVSTVLKACLQQAAALQMIPINPCDNIKKPRAVDTDVGIALEQDELVKLIDGFRNHNLFEIVFLAAFTGMRRGELLGLRWSDIDFDAKTITVAQSLEYTKQFGLQFKPPKSERGKRTFRVDDEVVAMLFRLRDTYIRIHAGVTDDGADLTLMRNRGLPADWLVFPAPAGQPNQPRHPDAVTHKIMDKAEKVLGYSIRLHDLRVTCGTLLLDRGVPVHVVAKRLGHDPAVLLRTYAKRTKGGDDQAADVIGAITRTLGGKQ